MAVSSSRRLAAEDELLRWTNALLEASLFYLVLAAWARPRAGAGAALPMLAVMALLAGVGLARLLGTTTVSAPVRWLTLGLADLAWASVAARLCAAGGSGQLELTGGLAPLAFWSSLLLWWRGVMLSDWLPSLDDALLRLRIGGAIGLGAVGFAAAGESESHRLIELEQVIGVALFLTLALLTTALARRAEMGGWMSVDEGKQQTGWFGPAGWLGLLAVAAGTVVILALASMSADLLAHEAIAPIIALAWNELTVIVGLVANTIGQLVSLLPAIFWPELPPLPLPPEPGPTDPSSLSHRLPEWLGWVGVGFGLLTLAMVAYLFFLTAKHVRFTLFPQDGIRAVSGVSDRPPRSVEVGGPSSVLALLLRLFRGMPGSQRPKGSSRPEAGGARQPAREQASAWSLYRSYLAWAASQNCARFPGETPDELLVRLSAQRPEIRTGATTLTALYVAQRYGDRSVSTAELADASLALDRLIGQPGG